MASIMRLRDDCTCAKGGGRKHKAFRIRTYVGRTPDGRVVAGRSRTLHGSVREASALAHAMDAEIKDGRVRAPADMTVEQYLGTWFEDEVRVARSERTQADYRRMIDRHLLPIVGTIRLRDLAPDDVLRLRNEILRRPARRTGKPRLREARYAHQVLRSALTHAINIGLVKLNVARAVTVPAARSATPVPHDGRVLQRVRAAVRGSDIELIVETTLRTGLRREEVMALRWQDLDLERRTARIAQTLQRIAGRGLVIGPTKTHRSERKIRLDVALVAMLRAHREEHDVGDGAPDDIHQRDLVFGRPDGRPWDPDAVSKRLRKTLDAAGLASVKLKDLRHAFATENLAIGASVAEVQAQLGHASATTTMNFYVSPNEDRQAAMVDRFGAMLDANGEHEVDDLLTDRSRARREGAA